MKETQSMEEDFPGLTRENEQETPRERVSWTNRGGTALAVHLPRKLHQLRKLKGNWMEEAVSSFRCRRLPGTGSQRDYSPIQLL